MMLFDEQLKQLEEKEKKLLEEAEFFNQNVEWWVNEFSRHDKKFKQFQKRGFNGVPEEEIKKLMQAMEYLAGKAILEGKVAQDLDKKYAKLDLEYQLLFIQGDLKKRKKSED